MLDAMRHCAPPQLQISTHLHLLAKAHRSSISHFRLPDVPETTPPLFPLFPVFLLLLRGPVISSVSAAAVSWRLLFVLSLISQSDPRRLQLLQPPHPHCTSSSPSDHTLCMLRPCTPTSLSGCCACERSVAGGRGRHDPYSWRGRWQWL